MRVGEYELRLLGPSGEPFPEVQHTNGQTYAVASPGTSFTISFSLLPHAVPLLGIFRAVSIHVDGVGVGYSKLLQQPQQSAVFDGFLKAGDVHGCTFRSFVFSQPQESEEKQLPSTLDFQEGKISARVYMAATTGQPAEGRHQGPAETNESIAKLPEGKKFFMAPSLTTGAGALRTGRGFSGEGVQFLGGHVAQLDLRYETPSTLLLRGVLQQDNPAHAAILQQFPETAALKQEQRGGSGAGPLRAAARGGMAAADGAGRKRQRGRQLKEEGDDPEIVDLTDEAPRADDEVLAAKRAHKVLECDLTAGDGAPPRWEAKEQGAQEVE